MLRSIVLLIFSISASALEFPRAVFHSDSFDFGKQVTGTVVEHEFLLKNEGSGVLQIKQLQMTPPLTVSQMPAEVAAGAEGVLRFSLDTAKVRGVFEGQILVSLNDPALPEVRLSFEGQVVPTVELAPMGAFFLAFQRGEKKESSIEIINHESEPLRIEKIEHFSERFVTQLETLEEGSRYRLTLTAKPDGEAGKRAEPILIKTSSKTEPVLKVTANTYLRERVYTFPDVLDLGAIPIGLIQKTPGIVTRAAQTLMIYQSGGSDFKVELRTDLPVELKLVRGPNGDRFQATITLIPEKVRVGEIRGSIFIETNDLEFPRLSIPVSGRIIGP